MVIIEKARAAGETEKVDKLMQKHTTSTAESVETCNAIAVANMKIVAGEAKVAAGEAKVAELDKVSEL